MRKTVRLGTRGSDLALWQTNWVKQRLQQNFPKIDFEIIPLKTTGDKNLESPLSRMGDKGLFTKELDMALLENRIDLAVHSMKDVPTQFDDELTIAAVTQRWDARDALISRKNKSLDDLPDGGVVATGSVRRQAQLLHYRPDVGIVNIRGNLNTRFRKFDQSDWDAMILASAGVERLNYSSRISQKIPFEVMLPAVGQGCFAVMTRRENDEIFPLLSSIHVPEVSIAVSAERTLLRKLEGGCQIPLGALGEVVNGTVKLRACVVSLDGEKYFHDEVEFPSDKPEAAGETLAQKLIDAGAGDILREIRNNNNPKPIPDRYENAT